MYSTMQADSEQQIESDVLCMIWLDSGIDANKNKHTEKRLRSLINTFKKFDDVKPCQKYIEKHSDGDKIVLIVTGQLGREIIPNIHELEQVESIYIFCYNTKNHEEWARQYSKVKAVVNNFNLLLSRISEDHHSQKKEVAPLPIDIFTVSGTDQSTMDVNGQFVFTQVLFDCLLRLKYSQTDRDELISCCKNEYKTDKEEQQNIYEFERNYKPDKALQWYTKDMFLYKSLNAALRKQNIHMIFLFRQCILDIQEQLKNLQSDKVIKVYRGQMMSNEEIDRLKNSIGKIISINSFLSTTLKKGKAFSFFKSVRDLKRVLFEINIDPKVTTTKPFADISVYSVYPEEAEVLFMVGSIFRLDSVNYDDEDFWIIRMTLSSDDEHGLREVLMYMKGQIQSGETNLRTLGKVLSKMGKFDLAEKYFKRLLKELQAGDPLIGILYEDLADLAAFQGNYDASVHYQQKAFTYKSSKEIDGTKTTDSLPIPLIQQVTVRPDAEQQVPAASETTTSKVKEEETEHFKTWLANYLKDYIKNIAQQSSSTARYKNSVENFCYIIENQASITDNDLQMLRGLINFGFTFDDVNSEECIKLFESIKSERIILIVSKNSLDNLAKQICEEPLLNGIYVLDSSKEVYCDLNVYRGCFRKMTRVCKQLEKDLPSMAHDLTLICSIPSDYTKVSTFSYVQSLKFIILETDEKQNLKQEMINFCREKYADNAVQLKLIDEFESDAQSENAIQWFLRRETFVYKMLTRAFRVLDPDILYKLRYVIQHTHKQIHSSSDLKAITVYRTLRLQNDLFKKMCTYENGILSFNEFLFVNTEQATDEPWEPNRETKLVHFEMNLEEGAPRYTISDETNEILLTVGMVFRIDSIKAIGEQTFNVKLTTNSDIQRRGPQISRIAYAGIRGPFPLVSMIKLMRHRDLYYYLEYFANMLENDPRLTGNDAAILTLGRVHHSVGSNYFDIKQYDEALVHFQKALDVYFGVLSPDDIILTATYNNIGAIYARKNMNEKALEYYLKAYEIQKNSNNPTIESVVTYAQNIADALDKLGKNKEAIKYYEMILKIHLNRSSNRESAEIAVKYFNLAGRQYRAQMYTEALKNYQNCLAIELKCHSDDNPTVAATYRNMAAPLEELGQCQEAKVAVEKAIERLRRTKNEDDEEVKATQKYLKQLEQKLWMKDILL